MINQPRHARSLRQSRRRRVRLGAAAAAVAASAFVLAGPSTAASAGPAVVVSGVSVSPSTPFTLTQNQTAVATVTFRLHVPAGQATSYVARGRSLAVPAVVSPGAGPLGFPRKTATLVTPTRKNGVWSARVPLAASLNGTYPLSVQVCPRDRNCDRRGPITVSLGVSVTVHGSDAPVITNLTQSPARLPRGATHGARAIGHVAYATSHGPAAGLNIALQRKGRNPKVVAHTDAKGRFDAPWPWAERTSGAAGSLLVLVPANTGSVVADVYRLPTPASRFTLSVAHPQYAMAGGRYVVTGSVSPGFPAPKLGTVSLQRLQRGHWRTVDTARVRSHRRGDRVPRRAQFRLAVDFAHLGSATLRVVKSDAMCTGTHCRVTGIAGARFDVVTGSRDQLVERQLKHFGYPVGPVDGVIDARARQALCAWRDTNGLTPSRAGVNVRVAQSVLNATGRPKADRGDGLYVTKTCQILFQVVNGKYKRIVWASTGMPGHDTPNVIGAIFRKVPGPVESTLYPGAFMYWPMFFNRAHPGIALHGSMSNDLVAPYPASHGCIRVWRPQIVRIYKETPLGTKVQVYGKY